VTVASYDRPGTIDQAIRSNAADAGLPGDGRAYIMGGTELVPLMRAGIARPKHLVDLRRAGLPSAIDDRADGVLTIGAGATMSAVAAHAAIRARYRVLAEALLASASPQVRNMASIGGNLLQRTRCGYFRDTMFPCNKRVPGSGCPAQRGHNRLHGILGGSASCVAVHPSDLAVGLAAVDAHLLLVGPQGERRVRLTDFYLDPGDTPWRETVLADRELIAAVECPAPALGSAYIKVRDRAAFEFALVSAAAAVDVDSGMISRLAIALGGVAARPWRLPDVEAAMVGRPLTRSALRAALDASLSDAAPLAGNAFKIDLARAAAERAVSVAGGLR
jgi:xanthine dehydrogenase YagS FAD-binding subunit